MPCTCMCCTPRGKEEKHSFGYKHTLCLADNNSSCPLRCRVSFAFYSALCAYTFSHYQTTSSACVSLSIQNALGFLTRLSLFNELKRQLIAHTHTILSVTHRVYTYIMVVDKMPVSSMSSTRSPSTTSGLLSTSSSAVVPSSSNDTAVIDNYNNDNVSQAPSSAGGGGGNSGGKTKTEGGRSTNVVATCTEVALSSKNDSNAKKHSGHRQPSKRILQRQNNNNYAEHTPATPPASVQCHSSPGNFACADNVLFNQQQNSRSRHASTENKSTNENYDAKNADQKQTTRKSRRQKNSPTAGADSPAIEHFPEISVFKPSAPQPRSKQATQRRRDCASPHPAAAQRSDVRNLPPTNLPTSSIPTQHSREHSSNEFMAVPHDLHGRFRLQSGGYDLAARDVRDACMYDADNSKFPFVDVLHRLCRLHQVSA